MQSDPSPTDQLDPLKGLPPVLAPSGKFIAQLFVVPGLIVSSVVGCILFVNWLVGGSYTPEAFIKGLRTANAEERWRRASDLAQVIKKDDTLATNPTFALDLAELLRQGLRENIQSERSTAERIRKQGAREEKAQTESKLAFSMHDPDKAVKDERAFIEFMIAGLGNFSVPVGVPLLCEIAVQEEGGEPKTIALRRQLSVWGLANLGENIKRFDNLSSERQEAVLATLTREVATATPERSRWARWTLDYISMPAAERRADLVADTLAKCAASDDATLRKFVALALSFWSGSPDVDARMDNTLLGLSKDDGHGAEPNENALRGREIRYQATIGLARRGSPLVVGRIPVLAEMLDEPSLAKVFVTTLADGKVVPDGALIGSIMQDALKSLVVLHNRNAKIDLSSLRSAIDVLEQSKSLELRKQAQITRTAIFEQ